MNMMGAVPENRSDLEKLPGVGRKTANVVCNVAFGQPTIAVDTHIFRIGNRTGLAPGKDPLEVERSLEKITPEIFKLHAHHWLILHGRYICKARTPDCPNCIINDICLFKEKTTLTDKKAAPSKKSKKLVSKPKLKSATRKKSGTKRKTTKKAKAMTSLNDRIIIALDKPTVDEARAIITSLGDQGTFYKIGYQLMPIGGLDLAQELINAGKKVFFDFKFHDIGATVEKGVKSVRTLGGDFFNSPR